MQTKCYASLDFFFIFDANALFFYKDADAKCPYDAHVLLLEVQFSWCRCPMRWCKCNVYLWWCQRTYLPVMQMSPYRDGDAKCLMVQVPSNGHVMMQMLLVGMSWCKCPFGACHDANVHLWVCHDTNVHVGMSWCKCPLVGMSWCECPYDANVLLWVCRECECPLVGM